MSADLGLESRPSAAVVVVDLDPEGVEELAEAVGRQLVEIDLDQR
ncbi:hypothetical protein AB0J82_21175 [Asanoa sp. NPDC049518]